MLNKIFNFFVSVAIVGFLAIFVAAIFYVILAVVFRFAMIPVFVIAGDDIAKRIMNFAGNDFGYKIVYIVVFITMMMDEMGIPNVKAAFGKWWKK